MARVLQDVRLYEKVKKMTTGKEHAADVLLAALFEEVMEEQRARGPRISLARRRAVARRDTRRAGGGDILITVHGITATVISGEEGLT